jgi:hypothetical protein
MIWFEGRLVGCLDDFKVGYFDGDEVGSIDDGWGSLSLRTGEGTGVRISVGFVDGIEVEIADGTSVGTRVGISDCCEVYN